MNLCQNCGGNSKESSELKEALSKCSSSGPCQSEKLVHHKAPHPHPYWYVGVTPDPMQPSSSPGIMLCGTIHCMVLPPILAIHSWG
jgi:hypothetical protein